MKRGKKKEFILKKLSNRALYTLIVLGIILITAGVVYASVDKTKAWHTADGIQIKLSSGATESLQEAITNGDLGGTANINQQLKSSIFSDTGGSVNLMNPKKTSNGAASSWVIYNMGSGYGNSLQFWAYDNVGCGSSLGLCASRLTIMDNGNIGIGMQYPSYRLDVNGYMRATSGVCIGAQCLTSWPTDSCPNGWTLATNVDPDGEPIKKCVSPKKGVSKWQDAESICDSHPGSHICSMGELQLLSYRTNLISCSGDGTNDELWTSDTTNNEAVYTIVKDNNQKCSQRAWESMNSLRSYYCCGDPHVVG